MDTLVRALGPAFAAGFALQQLMELVDPILGKVKEDKKKTILGIVSLVVGLVLAFGAGLRVLQPLGVTNADFWDAIVTGVIVSAGTDGFNSIMKFLGYTKEKRKAEAETAKEEAEEARARRRGG
jgi:Mg/Co/Ni transporter MgtE